MIDFKQNVQISYLDITVTHPGQKKHIQPTDPKINAGLTALVAAKSAHADKVAKYEDKIKNTVANSEFLPFVMETFGAIHPEARRIIQLAAANSGGNLPEDAIWSSAHPVAYWTQRVSIANVRGTARAILKQQKHWRETEARASGRVF